MRCKVTKTLFPWFLVLTLALAAGVATPKPAVALSVYDYFTINYDTEFSESVVGGGDVFYATVEGTADCKQDMPLTVSKGYITSRVVAQHRESGHKATLNPSYTIDIEPFPNEQGETTEAQVVISLAFPSGSPAGIYDIAGELIEAKVRSTFGFWLSVTSYLPSIEELGSVSYQPDEEDFTIVGSIFDLSLYLDSGLSLGDHSFQSDNGGCRLVISDGTLCLTSHGKPLAELTITEMAEPPTPPPGYHVVGLVYQLGPDGATFDPPLTLSLSYETPLVSASIDENELAIGMWDETNSEWIILEDSTTDPTTNTTSAALSHFSAFTILAPTPALNPANFIITDLTIAPEEAKTSEEITISVLLTNSGDLEGIYSLSLEIDETIEDTSDITLSGDSSRRVIFTTQKSVPGTYNVHVNGLSGTFKVEGASPLVSPSWWLIGGIIAAVAAAIAIPLVLRRRRRGI